MKERIKRLYLSGMLTDAGLHNAVPRWITEEEYNELIALPKINIQE
jgi:hypothetical protein